ncbi:MAG: hypothetical protein K2Y37_03055 [Pirellulales bacterium]|nr:hypothetical protein [Pirellulales bacterium]
MIDSPRKPTTSATPLPASSRGSIAFDAARLARAAEWIAALAAMLLILGLHLRNYRHAGPLWRDEAQTAALATLPAWSDVWQAMPNDSFPPLATAAFRAWSRVFGDSDASLRKFGFLVGIAILAAMAGCTLALYRTGPTVALALWGMSPISIRYGDAVRPYGLGVLWVVLSFGLVAKLLERPTWPRAMLAALSLIASVQTVYSSTVLVAALVTAATLVALASGRWKLAAIAIALGLAAATSLLPYAGQVRAASEWSALTLEDVSFSYVWQRLLDALAEPTSAFAWLWGGCCAAASIVAWRGCHAMRTQRVRRDALPEVPAASRERHPASEISAFAVLVVALAVPGMLLFFWWMRVPARAWHYLPTIALLAAALDAALAGLRNAGAWRIALLALGLVLGLSADFDILDQRQSNLDQIAARLNERAEPGDLVIVSPWYAGVTFHRYYHGAAAWTTLPSLETTALHRFDLLKQRMTEREPLAPLVAQIEAALRSGHRVWLVGGGWRSIPPGSLAPRIDPAPHPKTGWRPRPYLETWMLQVKVFLLAHLQTYSHVPLDRREPISQLENFELWVTQGWNP